MRVNIKTSSPVKDKDIKAMYIMNEGVMMSTDRMREINLKLIADKYGYHLVKKATNLMRDGRQV